MDKRCSRCKLILPKSPQFFRKNKAQQDGFSNCCKACSNIYQRRYEQELIVKYGLQKMRDLRNERVKKCRRENPSAWARQRNKDQALYFKRHPSAKIIKSLRNRLYSVVKGKKAILRSGLVENLVGCSHQQLKRQLEGCWRPGMSWGNYGKRRGCLTWHVDHIVPIAFFDAEFRSKDPKRIARASALVNRYTNLFPMWGPENAKKKAKMPQKVVICGNVIYSDLHQEAYKLLEGEDFQSVDDADRQYY